MSRASDGGGRWSVFDRLGFASIAGDGNEVEEGTFVIDEETGDFGRITDLYPSTSHARVVFRGPRARTPRELLLSELSVAADQEWPS